MNVVSGDRARVTFFFIWKLIDTVAFVAVTHRRLCYPVVIT